jgi:hypothetical protein
VKKQKCRKANGEQGNFVVYRLDTKTAVSCHKTEKEAHIAKGIREKKSKDV